ncbi:hypothetical protein GOEFS_044_00160 [Gordonia effusa NBRC 100432]|uniref:Uncharacterized protein n=1 Tax=Gordonia effusa NBRC 100432 TaxID=1077974 RepID=H0QYS9_9ACTN|nr:hypothetical protein [Gordonia effusa]GAB17980.1 hypothetical protein GOEFS_044_00160 [Gordonia effusa NBRC 100432]
MTNITPSASDDTETDQLDLGEVSSGAATFDADPYVDEAPAPIRRSPVPAVRAGGALVILIALFVSTWYATSTPTRYVVTTSPAAVNRPQAPGAGPVATKPLTPSAVPTATGPAPAASVPIGNSPTGAGPTGTVPIGNSPTGTAPSGTATPGTSVTIDGGTTGLSVAPVLGQAKCPLGWPKPEKSGGLASMILLAPAAGPFSSEAFALGSVYQPLMQLAGPLLAEIEPIIDANISWINPIIKQVQGAEAVVLEAILPFYGPYRSQFLAAEGNLAKVLAPILTRIYQSPQAACLVAWQGQIISAAKGKEIKTASLSRPGQFNTYE